MSDIAMTLTHCVTNVEQAWHVATKQPGFNSSRLCCFGAFNKWSINVDIIKQLKQAIVTEWDKLPQRLVNHAILVSGVAGLSVSSSSKADTS